MKLASALALTWLGLLVLMATSTLGADVQPQSAVTEVVATGVGLDADKALKNALMNAVQQVVGAIVDAETLVKNEDIIKDQILTYSDGFVETFRKLDERKRDDGLIEVRISATVKRRQLIEKLKESKVSVARIDGGSLFGDIATQYQAEKSGAELLKNALDGLPVNLLSATVITNKPQILEKTDSSVKARWFIEVKFDWNDYETKVLPRLKEALGAVAKRKSTVELIDEGVCRANPIAPNWLTALRQRPFWGENQAGMPGMFGYSGTDIGREFVRLVDEVPMDREKELLMLLNVGRTTNLGDRRWVWYVLDAATVRPVLAKSMDKKLMLRVAVLDSEGQPLRQVDIQINNTRDALFSGAPGRFVTDVVRTDNNWMISESKRNRPPTFQIGPYIYVRQYENQGADYGEALTFDYTADFTWDEIKKITEIRCSIVIGSPSNR